MKERLFESLGRGVPVEFSGAWNREQSLIRLKNCWFRTIFCRSNDALVGYVEDADIVLKAPLELLMWWQSLSKKEVSLISNEIRLVLPNGDDRSDWAIKVLAPADWESFDDRPLRRAFIVRTHGGEGDEMCLWGRCRNRVLKDMAICVDHAFPEFSQEKIG